MRRSHRGRSITACLLTFAMLSGLFARETAAKDVHLGMGVKVGEVSQTSAIVWTRITAAAEPDWNGYRDETKREPRVEEYVSSKIPVASREGELVGADGQVRLLYSTGKGLASAQQTKWVTVVAEHDFTHQFHLKYLKPDTRYFVRVEARASADDEASARATATFTTPVPAEQFQEVSFGVITGQAYWDLDDPRGYHIYPAMQRAGLNFLIPTGDTVYMDSESPRARTEALARYHWHRMYALPRHIELHRQIPGYWEVDDHDSWVNDCWPTMTAKWMNPLTFKQGYSIFLEQVPMGKKTYRTYRWGKGLQIWLVEGRTYRSSNKMKDGPDKTIWGKEQMAWLKKSILESDADFRVLISPTPIVGPDRTNKADNHANKAFAWEGNAFRNWTKEQGLRNFFTCCGDRHWQYMSIDPATKLREFSCGPVSDKHAGGSPGHDKEIQPYHNETGGFLSVTVKKVEEKPTILFQFHDVHGKPLYEYEQKAGK